MAERNTMSKQIPSVVAPGWDGPERAFLDEFYKRELVSSEEEKFAALVRLFGPTNISSAQNVEVTLAQKIAVLEYELLLRNRFCLGAVAE